MSEEFVTKEEHAVELDALKNKVRDLEMEIRLLQREKVDIETLHSIDKEIIEIKSSLEEVKNNREEDRKEITKLNESIDYLKDMLTKYITQNTEILLGQQESSKKMDLIKNSFDYWKKNEETKFSNIYKKWSKKSKFNRFVSTCINVFLLVGLATLIIAFYVSAIGGGDKTTWDMLIELIEAIRG